MQQQCGRHSELFQKLVAGLKLSVTRQYSQAFQPTRLYPKRHQSSEALAFWGIFGLNAATTILAKSDKPEVQHAVSQHFKTSVAAVSEGRWYTVLTSSMCHTSVVHCAVNLLMLLLYRRTQPLNASELLVLYLLGSLAGSCTHLAYCWYDAGGPDFGLKYAVNTPSLLGCSGAVAAITAYKAALQPMGLPGVTLPLPLPIAVLGFVYCCLYIREKDYSDYAGKFGGAALGVAAACISVLRGKRRFTWS